MFSLIVSGTPSSGEGRPARQRVSEAAAAARGVAVQAVHGVDPGLPRRDALESRAPPDRRARPLNRPLMEWRRSARGCGISTGLYILGATCRFALLAVIALSVPARAADIRVWHSMEGLHGAEFERVVARFNASQRQYRVLATYKGAYDEAAVEAVTARGSRNFAARAPHLVQASELGGAFLVEQKDVVRPLWQVMGDAGALLRPEPALADADELIDAKGRLVALPLGRATPVLYYNRDAFRVALLDPAKPPATWTEMVPTLAALVGAGSDCALTMAWPASTLLENMAAWHNQAFATDRLMFNSRLAVRWVSTLVTWQKSGYFTYAGHRGEAEARFVRGECALLAASSGSYQELRSRARFDLGVSQFPYCDDFDGAPLNTLASSAASG
jgi:sn-glycerol 3-phosphate transport system substrate-binding protein